jgi:hypothetical protein
MNVGKLHEIKCGYRNFFRFTSQWKYFSFKYRVRGVRLWCFHGWKNNVCDIWVDTGVRIFGVEISVRRWIPCSVRRG